jgi:predicted dienelactone hydrolase
MRLNTRMLAVMGMLVGPAFGVMASENCEVRSGCNAAALCAAPEDTSAPGAWTVGARTVNIKGLTVEVWYPAQANASLTALPKEYDMRLWLPAKEQKKIPDDKVPEQICDCYADLPFDAEHGPYPVVLFAHGTGAFRTQTLSLMTHLASRGFVVLAADHPGLYLGDLLQFKFGANVTTDLQTVLNALKSNAPELSFLEKKVALNHIGLIGHSAGGNAVSSLSGLEGVEFVVPMAAGGTQNGPDLKGSLIMGALNDKVVAYSRQQSGFAQSPSPKRLVGIANAGHLAFSDLCALKNKDGEDMVAVAQKYKIANAGFATGLWDGCAAGQLDPAQAKVIVNYAVAAGAEEVLQCVDRSDSFKSLKGRYKDVSEYKEAL